MGGPAHDCRPLSLYCALATGWFLSPARALHALSSSWMSLMATESSVSFAAHSLSCKTNGPVIGSVLTRLCSMPICIARTTFCSLCSFPSRRARRTKSSTPFSACLISVVAYSKLKLLASPYSNEDARKASNLDLNCAKCRTRGRASSGTSYVPVKQKYRELEPASSFVSRWSD